MQERLGFGTRVEVAAFIPQEKIGNERGPAQHMFPQRREFDRKQRDPAESQYRNEHDCQGGKDSPDPARVKIEI
jgi:hypothetical protein